MPKDLCRTSSSGGLDRSLGSYRDLLSSVDVDRLIAGPWQVVGNHRADVREGMAV